MKSYSEVNVLQSYVEEQTGFLNWFKSVVEAPQVKLELHLPIRYYLRMQMFVEDLSEYTNIEEEIELNDLIFMLASDLLEYYGKTFNALALKKHFENLSQLPIVVASPTQKKKKFKVKLDRKIVFKLEMLLSDIAEIYSEHPFKVEDVLRLVLLNFLNDVFNGNGEKLAKNIKKRLKN